MSLIGDLVKSGKKFDRYFWPSHSIKLTQPLREILYQHKLRIADVGSADGPEERWLCLSGLTQFITFEPNPRNEVLTQDDTINFPVGLWSKKNKKKLFITEHPDSSSLCKINREIFKDFLIKEGSQVVSEIEIELDTLDSCIEKRAGLSPQFLKVDVEGGDLEVMKGSQAALNSSVLGLRTEAILLPLWEDAPLLWEVNNYLNKNGFVLFNIGKIHWVRNNGLFGYTSQPQVIWGDAVYFITKKEFLKRLALQSDDNREVLIVHFMTILLAHGCHDYAMEILEAAKNTNLLEESFLKECDQTIRQSTDTSKLTIVWLFFGALFSMIIYVLFFPIKPARNHAKFYLKQRVGRFSSSLLKWSAIAGRPYGAAIEDQYD